VRLAAGRERKYNAPMARETELKFRVDSQEPVRRALKKAGAAYLGTYLQTDTFYDTPEQRLYAGGRGLRLRRVRCLRRGEGETDARALLTYKGPRLKGTAGKSRREIQTHLSDPTAAADIMRALGVRPVWTIQKRRAEYRFGPCLVTLDELPILGCFVEIEGPGVREIERVRCKLPLPEKPTQATYLAMIADASQQKGRGPHRVTFK